MYKRQAESPLVSCYIAEKDDFVNIYSSSVDYVIEVPSARGRAKYSSLIQPEEGPILKFQSGKNSFENSVSLIEKQEGEEFHGTPYIGRVVLRGQVFEPVSCSALRDF